MLDESNHVSHLPTASVSQTAPLPMAAGSAVASDSAALAVHTQSTAEAASLYMSPAPLSNPPQCSESASVNKSLDSLPSLPQLAEVASVYAPLGISSALPQLASAGTLVPLHDLPSFRMEAVSSNQRLPTPDNQGPANADVSLSSQDVVPAHIVEKRSFNVPKNAGAIDLQHLQHAAATLTSSSIQHASLSVASNLVIQSGANAAFTNNNEEGGMNHYTHGVLACRLPQPPDGHWLGCGQAAHAPIPCYSWQQMGLTHSNQIHDRVFAFTSSQLSNASATLNRMCAMRQPPYPDQNGPLKQGCGQLAHPDNVCATWIAAGVLTLPEVRQRLLEWKKRFPNAGIARNEYGVNKMFRKLPDKDRCVIPQPPNGASRGCPAGVHHRGTVCEPWIALSITKFEEIRPALIAWHQKNPNPEIELCDFVQPPDGSERGCGAPNHKGRICAAWAEMDVLTRQEAIKKVRSFRAQSKPKKNNTIRPDAEKLCNLPQPPDGRVIGCGEPFHRMAVCSSWLAFGVSSRDLVKAYVDKYREDTGTTANFARVCRALQPPDGRVKGCGLGWHRGVCPSWQELNITDRKSMTEYIQANIDSIASSGAVSHKRRISHAGISRLTEFSDYANDSDMSVRFLLEGDFDRSVQELTKRIRKYPKLASLYNNRGVVYNERGWSDLAIRDWFKAIELEPSYSDAFANRGLIRITLNKPLLAGDDCKRALSLSGGHSQRLVRLTYAMALYESGDFVKCMSECESLIEEDPDMTQAKILIGLANGAVQRFDESIRFFQDALETGFQKEKVSSLLEIAKSKLNDNGSAQTHQDKDSFQQRSELQSTLVLQEDHYDSDAAALSDSGTESIEVDAEDEDCYDPMPPRVEEPPDLDDGIRTGSDDSTVSDDSMDPDP